MTECGVLFGDTCFVNDEHGCILPRGHNEPHEFVDRGVHWLWETDFECDCEHCMLCEGDYCTIYWPK